MENNFKYCLNEKIEKWFCFIILVGLGIFLVSQSSLMPLTIDGHISTDTSVWLQVSREMLNGKMIYRDLFDHKGPVLFLLFSLFSRFGDVTGILLMKCLFLTITIVLCYKCAITVASSRIVATYVTILTVWGISFFFEEDFSVEEMSLPFMFGALLIFLSYFLNKERVIKKYKLVLLGICMGTVLGLRPNMIALWICFALLVILEKIYYKRYKELIQYITFFLLGFLGSLCIVAVWLSVHGALQAWWNDGFLFNFLYAGEVDYQTRKKIFMLFLKHKIHFISLCLNVVFIFRGKHERIVYVANLLYMFLNLILMSMSGMNYAHYRIALIPGYVLPLAEGGQRMWDYFGKYMSGKKRAYRFVLATLCLCVILGKNCYKGLLRIEDNVHISDSERSVLKLTEYTKQKTLGDNRITILGNSCYIYLETGCYSATDFLYTYPVCNISEKLAEKFIRQLKEAQPLIIILEKSCFEEKSKYGMECKEILEKYYHRVIDNENYELYERSSDVI